MGLLDDAIREHLDLKRQRGADPGEVEQMERDALGPVVRGDDLAPGLAGDAADFPSESEAIDYAPDAGYPDDELVPEPPLAEPHTELPAAEAGEAHPEPRAPSEYAGQPTEEFDVESAHVEEAAPHPAADEPAPAKGEHDVLEDTPDFLQETPEHDRLWFEQAPPQDFDFDK